MKQINKRKKRREQREAANLRSQAYSEFCLAGAGVEKGGTSAAGASNSIISGLINVTGAVLRSATAAAAVAATSSSCKFNESAGGAMSDSVDPVDNLDGR